MGSLQGIPPCGGISPCGRIAWGDPLEGLFGGIPWGGSPGGSLGVGDLPGQSPWYNPWGEPLGVPSKVLGGGRTPQALEFVFLFFSFLLPFRNPRGSCDCRARRGLGCRRR